MGRRRHRPGRIAAGEGHPRTDAAQVRIERAFAVIMHHEYPKLDPIDFPKGGLKRLKAIDAEREKQAKLCAQYCADARAKNPKVPPINLMMVLTEEPEPPTFLKQLDGLPTQVV